VADGGGPRPRGDLLPPEACDPLPPSDGQAHPGPCETQAKIVGAVESDDMLWSFVFVQPAGNGPAMPYRFGQTIDGRNVGIMSLVPALGAYVLLRPARRPRCFLAQNMPPRTAPPAPARPVAAVSRGPREGGALGAVLEGIERVGANEFNVRRSTVDRILENQAELMRTTRIMPVDQGGRVVGVQLFGVRGNSLLGRLGMQNGDVLNRINGLDIASPDRALEAYSRLRTSDTSRSPSPATASP
jgi:general secretion pathway protein C